MEKSDGAGNMRSVEGHTTSLPPCEHISGVTHFNGNVAYVVRRPRAIGFFRATVSCTRVKSPSSIPPANMLTTISPICECICRHTWKWNAGAVLTVSHYSAVAVYSSRNWQSVHFQFHSRLTLQMMSPHLQRYHSMRCPCR